MDIFFAKVFWYLKSRKDFLKIAFVFIRHIKITALKMNIMCLCV